MKRRCCIIDKTSGRIVFSSNKSWIVEEIFDWFGAQRYMISWQSIPV